MGNRQRFSGGAGGKKSLPMQEMQESWVQSLGQEDPLEKEMATYSSILVWEIPWTEEPGNYSPRGHKELDLTEYMTDRQFYIEP